MGVNWTPVDMVTFVTLDMDSWSYKCDKCGISEHDSEDDDVYWKPKMDEMFKFLMR